MTSNDLLDLLRYLAALPAAVFWPAVAWTLDYLRHLGGITSGVMAVLLTAVPFGLAVLLQRRLAAALEAAPAEPVGFLRFLRLELWHSVVSLPLQPFRIPVLLWRGLVALGRRATAWLGTRRMTRPAAPEGEPQAAAAEGAPEPPAPPPPPPLVVASLGPGFLLAGLATAALYLLARLAEPFLHAELGLSPGLSAWQYLFLGRRPELAWYLPLDRFPFLGGLLALLLWLAVWSLVGIALRLAFQRHLGRNLAPDHDDDAVLPSWGRWFGLPNLVRPAVSFHEWAVWLAVLALPLLAWAWLSLGGDPYRILPSEFAVAFVLWTSWSLHLVLRGEERLAKPDEEVEPSAPVEAAGWPEVLKHLEEELGVPPPEPRSAIPVEPLQRSEIDPPTAGLLSPLVAELLPRPRHLTPMQKSMLTRLAYQGFVHVDPPVTLDKLTLGEAPPEVLQDQSGQRSRNLIVLAPEGAGKSTLALLAAANHALVHTRGTLIVVRSEAAAEALAGRFRQVVEPSTLRWNLRVRHPGTDLMSDLAQGILPDVVVCSLHDLVATVLDRTDTFAPLLQNLGLVIVDDVETFAGPVEVHAQLAFRRLVLRLRQLIGVRELGEKSAPQVLVLGAESMHRMPEWVRSLCGMDAVARSFSHSAREAREREAAELAAAGVASKANVEAGTGREQRTYRLRDFQKPSGEPLSFADLVAACERHAVPWHYRLCGDGRRDLGRSPLLLREEPVYYRESPEEACVVLLEGTRSELAREAERLRRAGSRFRRWRGGRAAEAASEDGPEPIALVTMTDPDVDQAFSAVTDLPLLASEIASLPRPVLRPPTGLAVEPHLGADLVQHWMEVEDLVRVFGGVCVPRLRELAGQGLLLCEQRTDLDEQTHEYVKLVHVRALARAVRPEEGPGADDPGLLPPKIAQVEFTVRRTVALRDRTRLAELGRTGADAAHVLFYPGRIFQDARGIFVVVGRGGEEEKKEAAQASLEPGRRPAGDVLAEPLLTNEVSSPRRVFLLRALGESEVAPELVQAAGGSFPTPDQVLIGRLPFRVALVPVSVRVRHVATYRLDPVRNQVRQRTLFEEEARKSYEDLAFSTVALALFPNPADAAENNGDVAGPALTFEAARLLAAVLRAVLPAIYRGAGESLQVALHVENPEAPEPERLLQPAEGLFLFDAEAGGNGTARAVHRDGIDLLFRICRLVLRRVRDLSQLRALHDEWGNETEVLAESRADRQAVGVVLEDTQALQDREQRAREIALAWLDSRLQTEK
ncbi:MAG TPA: DEAD/DEAH box helicase family protein [Thermoanaerobaculia bacterium]|nr:DEAD/DEAH box helicase family protein [Thermoanaerobaculia bacterium]